MNHPENPRDWAERYLGYLLCGGWILLAVAVCALCIAHAF